MKRVSICLTNLKNESKSYQNKQMRNHKKCIAKSPLAEIGSRNGRYSSPLRISSCFLFIGILTLQITLGLHAEAQDSQGDSLQAKTIRVSVNPADGSYTISDPVTSNTILHAVVGAEVNHHWIKSNDYPRHIVQRNNMSDDLGSRNSLTISNLGLAGQPDLTYSFYLHSDPDFLTISVQIRNASKKAVSVQAIRSLDATGTPVIDLGANDASDRVLSDSFSEDRPGIVIRNLPDAEAGLHRAVGSQLIYNRDSKRNLFVGVLSSEKFLTVLRLHVEKDHITKYEVESTGTTELAIENSLRESGAEDRVELSLPLAPGAEIKSERLLISTGTDYLNQVETYGSMIRHLHHPREITGSPAGWWSWTAYYFGLSQGTALTNAKWLAHNLKDLGYKFFHIDEGYQYARGEYTTTDATLFPGGMRMLEHKISALGLTPGIWTAPFEISERSWVYENHKDWLIHNAAGQPIHAGWVLEERKIDPLYILDVTNPGAQNYLRQTYSTLTKDWGIRYIKLDFMDDSAIEGVYYKAHTTALEAQRIGLRVIREAVGEHVLLDKDGSPMLNPVGLVDTGRISVDTGHTFGASREAASGIAARFFMNGNYYLADPDAFTVARQTIPEQTWHGGRHPLTLDEAKVSIALAAIAGGMYEIGDDLPTLGDEPDRLALVKNQDLMNMARLKRSSLPLDLMSYAPTDEMPSIFLLHESKRQQMLTVFNWTDKPTEHTFDLAKDLGLEAGGHKQIFDVFERKLSGDNLDSVEVSLPPHSAKVFKIVDTSVSPAAPVVNVNIPDHVEAGKTAEFSAKSDLDGTPALRYQWQFGDGTIDEGSKVAHAFTYAGNFSVNLHVEGLDGVAFDKSMPVTVTGKIDTRFVPASKKRLATLPDLP
jgi:alpha-galactosidase